MSPNLKSRPDAQKVIAALLKDILAGTIRPRPEYVLTQVCKTSAQA